MRKRGKISFMFSIITFVFIFAIFYFIYHAFVGERGYIKMISLNKEIAQKNTLLKKIREDKEKLENKTRLLYEKSLDKDYLDELSRKYFGLIGENETCFYLQTKD